MSNTNSPKPGISYTIPQEAISSHNISVNKLIAHMQLIRDCKERIAEHAMMDMDELLLDADPATLKNVANIPQDVWMWEGLIEQVKTLQICPPIAWERT